MKKAIVLLAIFLILFPPLISVDGISGNQDQKNKLLSDKIAKQDPFYENDNGETFNFLPEDINLEDDAFHGSDNLHNTEWWYFDAAFADGFSVQLSIRVIEVLDRSLIFTGLNLYKDGNIISANEKMYFEKSFFASRNMPLVQINGKQVMMGSVDESTGNWIYNIDYALNDVSIDLRFEGVTKGWKGLTPGIGWWAVVLPRANVYGTLKINNVEFDVAGVGYHDHNWEVKAFAGINFGWFWGKINSESYTITWADVRKTRISSELFMVINKKNGDYINIPAQKIEVFIEDYKLNNGKLIPTSFIITANYQDINLYVKMQVFDTHHIRKFGIVNYWRYHVKCTGSILIDSQIEEINQINMAEFMRFR